MRSVTIEICKTDLAARLAAMRTWLDDRGVAPSRFRCNRLENGNMAVRVDFEIADQATTFGAAFSPEKIMTEPPAGGDAKPITLNQDNTSADQTKPAILVVDDEPDVRQLVNDVLSYEGFTIIEAESGNEALYRIRSNTRVDLLLTDIVMPGDLDGLELARRAKEFRPSLPIIYMSGYVKDLPPEQTAPDYRTMLRKPFANQQLIAEVGRALG